MLKNLFLFLTFLVVTCPTFAMMQGDGDDKPPCQNPNRPTRNPTLSLAPRTQDGTYLLISLSPYGDHLHLREGEPAVLRSAQDEDMVMRITREEGQVVVRLGRQFYQPFAIFGIHEMPFTAYLEQPLTIAAHTTDLTQ